MLVFNYGTLVDPLLRDLRKFVTEYSGLNPGDRVIDVCCGTGAQVLEFGRHGITAIGIDTSEAMLKIAAQNRIKQNAINASFQLADATDLPFPDNYFDYGTVTFGLHDKEKSIRYRIVSEMVRTVKHGGFLVLVDYQVPLPTNKWAIVARVLEFIAGGSHYRGFREYIACGGLDDLLINYGLKEVKRGYPLSGLAVAVKILND